jgi:hypothetical protein
MALETSEAEDLLNKHNPHLVIFPKPDRDRPNLARPHESAHGLKRGDYHPQRVDVFLKLLEQHEEVRPFDATNIVRPNTWPWPRIWKWPRFPWNQGKHPLPKVIAPEVREDGADALKKLILGSKADAISKWEVDLKPIRSQDPDQAWQVYRGLLQSLDKRESDPVAYGRCAETKKNIVLQYWYFYIYNDSVNKHEGDWEMASVVLDKQKQPECVGFAGHTGGAQRAWKDLKDPHGKPLSGDHPYLYVARGSHAGYLDHMPDGHKSVHVEYRKNLLLLGPVMDFGTRMLSRFLDFVGVEDFTPGHPDDAKDQEKGIEVAPEVIVFPERGDLVGKRGWEIVDAKGADLRGDSKWWWLYLDCRWGSSHSRFFASIGPEPPWMKPRWAKPLSWVKKLPKR